jgi:hypothetical protein
MQPRKLPEQRIHTIEEPGSAGLCEVPAMCIGCPENQQEATTGPARIFSLEDPVEYYISHIPQVFIGNAPDDLGHGHEPLAGEDVHPDEPGEAERVKVTQMHPLSPMNAPGLAGGYSLEDPVEYCGPQEQQAALKRAQGEAILADLRALLRADPDVILVGEIREAAPPSADQLNRIVEQAAPGSTDETPAP